MVRPSSKGVSVGEFFEVNRVPIAVIGVGIAWLFANNTGLTERLARNQSIKAAQRRIGETAGESDIGGASEPDRGGQILGPDGEPVLRTSDTSRGNAWVHQATGAARGAISSVREAGSAVLDRAGSSITSYAGNAGDLATRAGGQLAEKLERDPWLIGVAGFVAGALLATAAPLTRAEQELLGGAREELRNKATELGHEAAERVRELAETTTWPSRH